MKISKLIGFISCLLICFNFAFSQNLNQFASEICKLNVFILQQKNESNVFVGEVFLCDYVLLINSEIILTNITPIEFPSFPSFKSKEIILPQMKNSNSSNNNNLQSNVYTDTMIDGSHFKKAILNRYILTPRNAGEFSLEPIKFELELKIPLNEEYQAQYINEYPAGYYTFKYTLSSETSTSNDKKTNNRDIKVISLPKNNESPTFIGDFEMSWNISKITAKQNENITLNLTISGIGDLSIPFIPDINKSNGLKSTIYKTSDTFDVINNELLSKKTYEVDLLSSVEGNYIIQPIRILCFSPSDQQYYYMETETIPIFYTDSSVKPVKKKFDIVWIALTIVIIGIVVFIILAFIFSKKFVRVLKRKDNENKFNTTRKNTTSHSTKLSDTSTIYLSKAMQLINGDTDVFLKEIISAMNEYINDRFQINESNIKKEQVLEILIKYGIPSDVAKIYPVIVNKIEELRFSNQQQTYINKQQLFNDVDGYINELEKFV